MIGKLVILAVFSALFIQINGSPLSDLKEMTDLAIKNTSESIKAIDSARANNDKMVQERIDSLNYVYFTLNQAINGTIKEATYRGVDKKKVFNNFMCIGTAAENASKKLYSEFSQVGEKGDAIKEKGVAALYALKPVVVSFGSYIKDLYTQKEDEIKKAPNEAQAQAIVNGAREKVDVVGKAVEEVNNKITTMKYEFFEEFGNFMYTTENNLRKLHREGTQQIFKCVN